MCDVDASVGIAHDVLIRRRHLQCKSLVDLILLKVVDIYKYLIDNMWYIIVPTSVTLN